MNERWQSNKGWLFVLPVVVAVAANALIPLMTVVNYSVQLVRGPKQVFRGFKNYEAVLQLDPVRWSEAGGAFFVALVLLELLVGGLLCRNLARRGRHPVVCALGFLLPVFATVLVERCFAWELSWAWTAFAAAIVFPVGAALWTGLPRHGWKAAAMFAIAFPLLLPFALNWPFIHQLCYSLLALGIQIPLGIGIALLLPRGGLSSGLAMVVIAIPLLIPLAVIGFVWRVYTDPGIGMLGRGLGALGWDYNPVLNWFDSWFTIVLMDVWHWTSLVALLAFAGLRSIPPAWYQASQIDGASRWATFRHVELPKLRAVLIIAVLLRFMDSFMVFTEPFLLNAGGPGSATEMLSTKLYQLAKRGPTEGKAAAFSILYLLFVLLFSYLLYTAMMRAGRREETAPRA